MTIFFSVFVDKFRRLIFSGVGWENILPPSFGCCSKLGFSLVFQKCFYVKDALRKKEEKKKKRRDELSIISEGRERILNK